MLTTEAVVDLDRMAAEGALRFGYARSVVYEQEIVAMLDALALHPHMAPEREATHSLVRLMPCGSHNILYMVDDQDIVVLRVLHGLQNWFDLL